MRRFLLPSLFLIVCCTVTGCSLDRTWFQMSSNSPIPLFGFDLRLPRKTSRVEESVTHEEQLATHWDSENAVQPVSHKKSHSKTTFLNLPRISTLIEKHPEEELSFTGPKSPFAP